MLCSCRVGTLRLFVCSVSKVHISVYQTWPPVSRLGQGTLRHDVQSLTTPWPRAFRTCSAWKEGLSKRNETDEGGLKSLDLVGDHEESERVTDTAQSVELPDSSQSSPLTQTNNILATPKAVELSETHHPPESDVTVQTGTYTGLSSELTDGDKSLLPNITIEADTTNKSDAEDAERCLPAGSALETRKKIRPRPKETLKEKKRRLKEAQRLEAAQLELDKPSKVKEKQPSTRQKRTRSRPKGMLKEKERRLKEAQRLEAGQLGLDRPSTAEEKQSSTRRKNRPKSPPTEDTPGKEKDAPSAESGASADDPPEQRRVKNRWRRRAEGEGPRTKAEQKAMRKARLEAMFEEHRRAREAKKWPEWWPQWRIQKAVLKAKFPDGWKPLKKLSPDACAGIRALHQQFPDQYTTPVLADKFKVSPESIRRILKRKRPPTEEQKDKQAKSWHERGKKIWARYAELGVKPPRMWRQEGVTRPPEFHNKRRRRAEWRDRELRVKMAEKAEKLATEPGFEEEMRRSLGSARDRR